MCLVKMRSTCWKRQKAEKLQGPWLVVNQYFLGGYTLLASVSLCVFTGVYVGLSKLQLHPICCVAAGSKSKVCCPLEGVSYALLKLPLHCYILVYTQFYVKLQAKESGSDMKPVLCRLVKEFGQVCCTYFSCKDVWQRQEGQIKAICSNMLFSKCFCFQQC